MTERPINLKHLYYFWKVATHGGVVRASEAIFITPQTLSSQLKLLEDRMGVALFEKQGRGLELTDAGRLALEYAEEIFALGAELDRVIHEFPKEPSTEFRVGLTDTIPKALAFRLLKPIVQLPQPIRLLTNEGPLTQLLGQLALDKIDLIISDAPVPQNSAVRAISKKLGESGIAFVAREDLVKQIHQPFPECLKSFPLLLPRQDSAIRQRLNTWFDKKHIKVNSVGEFDDNALLAAFGREGIGAFPVSEALLDENLERGNLKLLGKADGLSIHFFAITIKRHVPHACLKAITGHAEDILC
ncbi:MAG: LysR family transcriptional regulator [Fluviibacter sp.]